MWCSNCSSVDDCKDPAKLGGDCAGANDFGVDPIDDFDDFDDFEDCCDCDSCGLCD